MNGRRRLFGRSQCSRGWLALAAVATALTFAGPGAAQESADQVVDRELAYRSAGSQYQAALDAWGVIEKQWNDAVEEHAQARRAADDQRKDDALVVWVEDEGPGLPDSQNLFVPFFTTKPEGSGIGLALSRQIAEGHGGGLTLRNRPDRSGCRAELWLPPSA